MTLSASLALVKEVPPGHGISYGHHYTTSAETTLALVPVGYADGVPRHASGRGPVLIDGTVRTIAGRVAMDQFVVDLGGDTPNPARGRCCSGRATRANPAPRTGRPRRTPSCTRSSPGSAAGCPGSI